MVAQTFDVRVYTTVLGGQMYKRGTLMKQNDNI